MDLIEIWFIQRLYGYLRIKYYTQNSMIKVFDSKILLFFYLISPGIAIVSKNLCFCVTLHKKLFLR